MGEQQQQRGGEERAFEGRARDVRHTVRGVTTHVRLSQGGACVVANALGGGG